MTLRGCIVRSKFGQQVFIIAGLCLAGQACKPKSSPSISFFIAQNCAQHPINFYFHEVEKGTQIYTYGHQDQEFRAFMIELQASYQQHGVDLNGQQKIEAVGQFLPNYIQTCQQFFQPLIEECSEYPMESPAFNHCLAGYNKAYEEALSLVIKKSGPERIDLDSISLTRHQRISEADQVH